MRTKSYLVREEHIPARARFPAIDAHNHLWANWKTVDDVIKVMNETGVRAYCDLTANLEIEWVTGGYAFRECGLDGFFRNCADPHPGRFYGFTAATFGRPVTEPLFTDADEFVARTIETLRRHVERGARGLKILKELGLFYRDGNGELLRVDDERFAPVWNEAAVLKIPVLMHQGDPRGFFDPAMPDNEHYLNLKKYPAWSFADPKFPRKEELLARRDRLIEAHPDTTFLLPHVANCAEDLGYVSELLDRFPNVYIDFSARMDELGRQPYRARDFLIRYQDRVYFGTDMPASAEMYRCYFRFLETFDEHFVPPAYDGTFGEYRWHVHGLGLPPEVLRKIYRDNTLAIIPGLRQELGSDIS